MTEQFDPYYKWLGIPPEEQPPHHYRLLGLRCFEGDAEVIESAADQRMLHLRTFQTGRRSVECQRLLNEVAAARVCLLNADQKNAYDTQLRDNLPTAVQSVTKAVVVTPRATAVPVVSAEHAGGETAALPAITTSRVRTTASRSKFPWLSVALAGAGLAVLAIVLWALTSAVDSPPAPEQRISKTQKTNAEPSRSPHPSTPISPERAPWNAASLASPDASRPKGPVSGPFAVAPFDEEQAKEHQRNCAAKLTIPVEKTNTLGMRLMLIPPGEFDMGAPQEMVERAIQGATTPQEVERASSMGPQRRIRITRPYYLGKHEVTVGQFRQFVAETEYLTEAELDKGGQILDEASRNWQFTPEANWKTPGIAQTDDHPVVQIGWLDAAAFCQWLSQKEKASYRLPTEAEWEYACRAGTDTAYTTGESAEYVYETANLSGDRDVFPQTAPVGQFLGNPFGVHDMIGNLWEWCLDDYDPDYFRRSAVENPRAVGLGDRRVLRGGSWTDGAHRPDTRAPLSKLNGQSANRGFRVVLEIP